MECFETDTLQSCPSNNGPRVWFRYVDDVVEAIHKDVVDKFTAHLNSCNLSIQFTVEREDEDLDFDMERSDDGSSKFTKRSHTQINTSTSIVTIL